jgi:DNA-binding response OmpR family regulator
MTTDALRKKVLVVDDEKDILRSLRLRLTAAGYEVLVASDGVQGTQLALSNQLDVIVLDLGLPAGDGHAVAARLRDHASTMHVPIVFLTARTDRADVKRAHDAGAFAYLVKPYEPSELLEMVHKAAHGYRHHADRSSPASDAASAA